ncbi:hypothetical protein [Chondromyces crocatus]|uniref:Uncharacterized protein n=1 Tax=Chondromyces crocatus TaxID=52 RepID=A0A0K1EHT6_CHOCO|nr:hypothetical protein [Chondromyces crocatus]AKT40242.1 uncharacterized protein CMC5_043950 [Chondromyces crocatus]
METRHTYSSFLRSWLRRSVLASQTYTEFAERFAYLALKTLGWPDELLRELHVEKDANQAREDIVSFSAMIPFRDEKMTGSLIVPLHIEKRQGTTWRIFDSDVTEAKHLDELMSRFGDHLARTLEQAPRR